MLQLFYSSDSLWWMPKNKKKKIQNIHHEHTYFFKLLVHDILLHPKLNLKFFSSSSSLLFFWQFIFIFIFSSFEGSLSLSVSFLWWVRDDMELLDALRLLSHTIDMFGNTRVRDEKCIDFIISSSCVCGFIIEIVQCTSSYWGYEREKFI